MKELRDKVAVVTGAGSGIGRALAVRFAAEGMRVAMADVDGDALAGTVRLLADAPGGAGRALVVAEVVDVADADEVAAFADAVFGHGPVDVLGNNAGVFVGGYLWERTVEELQFVLGVNLWGILHGIRSFVPRMIAQDTEGHIVNTVSVAGLFGSGVSGPYNISKFAAFAATETLASDLIASGSKLRASALCPGVIATSIAERTKARAGDGGTPEQQFVNDLLVSMVPKGMDPAEVAATVVDGIRAEQFLILTHDHHAAFLEPRAAELVARRLPSFVDYT